jgi:hypothetical protein
VIARIWRRWRLPMTISIRLGCLYCPLSLLGSYATAKQWGQRARSHCWNYKPLTHKTPKS